MVDFFGNVGPFDYLGRWQKGRTDDNRYSVPSRCHLLGAMEFQNMAHLATNPVS